MTSSITIEDVSRNNEDPFDVLAGFLKAFNEAHAGKTKWVPLYLFARDEAGRLQGGIRGTTYWSWCFIEILAVAEDCRKRGIGSELLARAETVARERGCIGIYLWTTSYQAPEFYKRNGYTEFGRLPDLPPGHSAHWFMKRL